MMIMFCSTSVPIEEHIDSTITDAAGTEEKSSEGM